MVLPMKLLGLVVASALALQGGGEYDYGTAARIAVVHGGRIKPLDSMARELLRSLAGKEKLQSFRDPATGEKVEVFSSPEPVAAILRLAASPEEARTLRFIRLDHPKVKAAYGLEADRMYFSLADLMPHKERMHKELRAIPDQDNATTEQRAVIETLRKQQLAEQVMKEQVFAIIPLPFAPAKGWLTPGDVRLFLAGAKVTDSGTAHILHDLEEWAGGDASKRALLQTALDSYGRLMKGLRERQSAEFNAGVAALATVQRQINPQAVPTPGEITEEIRYHKMAPFHLASAIYALAGLLFIAAWIFRSSIPWWLAMAAQVAAIGMTTYGYGLRWAVANRYPLANHYESMIAVAFGAAIVTFIAEAIVRKRAFGVAGCVVSTVMILLANTVPAFYSQSAISTIMPALMTFWMTIHVPVIMLGYAGGAVICVLGHIYIFAYLFSRSGPERDVALQSLDDAMYRALQVTVLFLLAGIILGAVWAGEAWGRPWGWDMKETWALITLLSYLFTLHGRFTGVVRGMGTALAALGSFVLLVLCYYGVNFLFGKGLHTYGFGAGDWAYLFAFFGVEAAVALAGVTSWLSRRKTELPAPPAAPAA